MKKLLNKNLKLIETKTQENRIPLDERIKAFKEQSVNRENVIEKTRIKDTDLSR